MSSSLINEAFLKAKNEKRPASGFDVDCKAQGACRVYSYSR
jgi:hypothetical protein